MNKFIKESQETNKHVKETNKSVEDLKMKIKAGKKIKLRKYGK